jgi:hypothetical protein
MKAGAAYYSSPDRPLQDWLGKQVKLVRRDGSDTFTIEGKIMGVEMKYKDLLGYYEQTFRFASYSANLTEWEIVE